MIVTNLASASRFSARRCSIRPPWMDRVQWS